MKSVGCGNLQPVRSCVRRSAVRCQDSAPNAELFGGASPDTRQQADGVAQLNLLSRENMYKAERKDEEKAAQITSPKLSALEIYYPP